MSFCQSCGSEVGVTAVVCVKCGSPANGTTPTSILSAGISNKEWLTTLLLCVFLGALGIHRFYVGNNKSGLVMLLTIGGCGIWTFIDFIMIATGSFRDSNGLPLKR